MNNLEQFIKTEAFYYNNTEYASILADIIRQITNNMRRHIEQLERRWGTMYEK